MSEELTAAETEACSTREEWARLFIGKNPSAHALEVIGAYNRTDLGERWGYFSLDEILALQAEMEAASVTPESLEAEHAEAAQWRAEREKEEERLVALSHEELAELEDRPLVRAVITRLARRVDGDWASARENLPPVVRHVWTVFFLDADVRNGGFDQYFSNWSDDLVEDVTDGLRAMNAHKQVEIVARATALFRQKYPDGIDAAGKEGRDEEFDPLDTEYYDSFPNRRARIETYLAPYIRAHVSSAHAPPF